MSGVVQPHEQEIEGALYKTRTLSATEGIDLAQSLARVLADGLLDMIVQDPSKDFDVSKLFSDPMAIGVLLARSAQKAPQGELSELAKHILQHTTVRDMKLDTDMPIRQVFDRHFAGRYMHLFAVLGWVLSVSFGGS